MKEFHNIHKVSYLIGTMLSQICFGQFQICLNFSSGSRLDIECRLIFKKELTEEYYESPYTNAGNLLSLLGVTVIDAQFTNNGDLLLKFDSQFEITVCNSNLEYESYQISNGDDLIVV